MQFKTVWAVYYSGCGSTRRLLRGMAEAAGEALMLPVRELDYSRPEAREKNYCFTQTDLVFWGSPTYAGRLPNVLLPFLRGNFTGGGAAAVGAAHPAAKPPPPRRSRGSAAPEPLRPQTP